MLVIVRAPPPHQEADADVGHEEFTATRFWLAQNEEAGELGNGLIPEAMVELTRYAFPEEAANTNRRQDLATEKKKRKQEDRCTAAAPCRACASGALGPPMYPLCQRLLVLEFVQVLRYRVIVISKAWRSSMSGGVRQIPTAHGSGAVFLQPMFTQPPLVGTPFAPHKHRRIRTTRRARGRPRR